MITSILSAAEIRALCQSDKPMLTPFQEPYRWHGVSGGLDYNGYCISLGDKWVENNALRIDTACIKAANTHKKSLRSKHYTLAPGASVLAVSRERFDMPPNVLALSFGKSTLARINVVTHVTPIEAGWSGHLTIEINNANKSTEVVLREGLPITQLVFFWVMPSQYDGIYQHQPAVPVSALGNGASQ